MGTRGRVNVVNGNKRLISIYRQLDGYPSGLGLEIAEFCAGVTVINGYCPEQMAPQYANGIGCLAAQLVKHLKEGIGSIYIRDTGDDSRGEEFVYDLSVRDGRVWLAAYEGCMTAFGNPGDEQSSMRCIWAGYASDFDPEKVTGEG